MADSAVFMVLTRLGEMMKDEVNLHLDSENEIEKLSGKLDTISKVLADAEQKGITDPKVKSWLNNLQDIAYDIDDVLDEWTHEQLLKKYREEEEEMKEKDPSHPWDKVISFLHSVCLCFKHVVERRSIAVKVRELNEKLDSIKEQNQKEFSFIPDLPHVQHEFKTTQTSCQVDVSEARGREKELKDLENKLIRDSGIDNGSASTSSALNTNKVQVISIVGLGGMGKTFLAQLAFQKVKHRFDETAWVCVSHSFDKIKVAKAILEDLTMNSPNLTELNTLLKSIERTVEKKKFLIVLDDVWLENQDNWRPLWNTLKGSCAPGSKILVTTRSSHAAKTMGTVVEDITELGPLSESDCWSYFSQLAFQNKSPADGEMLEKTGRLIANKCKGLPLAAKIIGSHLSSTNRLDEWDNVLNANIWKWEKAKTDLFPILRLSYSKLDPASKLCFSYCALYPKDYEYDVSFMKRAWIAQGFVLGRDASEVEIEAQKIFDNLVASSFFQDFEWTGIGGCISEFKIHDIVHDFALSLIDKECLNLKFDDETPSEPYSLRNARYVRIESRKSTPFSFNHAENVRTFELLGTEPPENAFNLLKRVRLLLLNKCKIVPQEVGDMIHLRFLKLESEEGISELPGTICNLFELQCLLIDGTNVGRFPQGIHKLQNLRQLVIDEDIELPQGFEKLNNLRTLETFGANKKNKLGYLQNMEQLRELTIMIKGLNEVDDVREAQKANLSNKMFLEQLLLVLDDSDGVIRMDVVEALQPPTNLLHLELHVIQRIPDWMATLTNIRVLFLNNIQKVDWTLLSKLPALEKFTISAIYKLMNVGHDLLGMKMAADSIAPIFPRLKELEFLSCWNWEEWEDINEEEEKNNGISIFPCLQILDIFHCHELKALPHRLLRKAPNLKCLRVQRCSELHRRYNHKDGKDWEKISHIADLQIIQ